MLIMPGNMPHRLFVNVGSICIIVIEVWIEPAQSNIKSNEAVPCLRWVF